MSNEKSVIAKWSVSYLSQGFEVTITFEGEDLGQVMAKGKALLREMSKNGIEPVRTRPIPPKPHRIMK